MGTTLPVGALLALSLASCSNSANPLTGPNMEPGRGQEPTAVCQQPKARPSSEAAHNSRTTSTITASCASVQP
jgi:hypothetical protein